MSRHVVLHEGATRHTLAVARILVMVTWLAYLMLDPVTQLTLLPFELFHAYGASAIVPDGVWAGLLTPTGLLALRLALLVAGVWVLVGFRGARIALAVFLVGVVVWLQLKKGFGGHFDHRELTLLYVTFAMALTPAWDAWAARPPSPAPVRRDGVYRASMLALCLIVVLQYVFIGVARLMIGGPGVFLDGTLQAWVENRNLRPNPFGSDLGTRVLGDVWTVPLDLLLLAGTGLEIAALALFFLRPGLLKIGVLASLGVFHVSIFALLNVAFPENIVLLLLFVDFAARSRRPDAPGEPVTVHYDPGSPRAHDVVSRAVRRDRQGLLRVVPVPTSSAAALAVTTSDGTSWTGERAVTEILRRLPGGGWWVAVRRLGGAATQRDVLGERSTVGRWLFGPEGTEPGPNGPADATSPTPDRVSSRS